MNQESKHIWRFSRVGGVNRVNLERGEDLLHLSELDQKLWTALSCPVHGLEIDPKTLELIDTDNDDRIRVPEILNAVSWIGSVLLDPNLLLKQEQAFPLSALNAENPEGLKLLSSAKQILKNLGKPDSPTITVEDTSDIFKIFAKTKFNGDGIITEYSADDIQTKNIIRNIISCIGSVTDRTGEAGVSRELIESFFNQCELYSLWQTKAEDNKQTILPFGESTESAMKAFLTVKSKIEDFFIRCRLAEFDPQSTDVLNLLTTRFEAISSKDLSTCMDEIASYPIAKIEAKKALSLYQGINPAWEKHLSIFVQEVVNPIYKTKTSLSETEWQRISQMFDAYILWKSEKGGELVEQLGLETIRNILVSKEKETLLSLIDQDNSVGDEAINIILVDKLVRYYRDIFTLLKNFVTFYDFYSPDDKAIFQTGTLFIDQRSCDLCIKVTDMQKHSNIASLSGMFLIYCDCISKTKNEKMTIVAAMTNGDIDNLMVGRNAIFYDRRGIDWDATIIKVIENPISIRQAFWSPYRKVSQFVEKQINKFASDKDTQSHSNITSNIEKTGTKITTTPTPATTQPFDIGKFVGIFAAIGLAIGAIGSALASFIGGFLGLVWWKMPLAVFGIILIISGPSMLIAYLKLRKRNLAPILDANGWAVNARAIVNIPFGNTLTYIANLPKNAKLDFKDPFQNKKHPFLKTIIILSILIGASFYFLWKYGYFKKWGIL